MIRGYGTSANFRQLMANKPLILWNLKHRAQPLNPPPPKTVYKRSSMSPVIWKTPVYTVNSSVQIKRRPTRLHNPRPQNSRLNQTRYSCPTPPTPTRQLITRIGSTSSPNLSIPTGADPTLLGHESTRLLNKRFQPIHKLGKGQSWSKPKHGVCVIARET